MKKMKGKNELPERRICRAMNISRSTIRYQAVRQADEEEITTRIIELASQYGRYGYRRITTILRPEYRVNHKRVERIWREQGLKVPAKQPKRKRLWLNDGSCIRLIPEYNNSVWSYDFVEDRLRNGRKAR
jgi:transposase InsO family protein